MLAEAGIPCGPINSIDQVFAEPQVIHRKMKLELQASDGARLPGVASPINLSRTPVSYRTAPPRLGEHSRAILATELGLSQQDIDQLISRQIVAQEQ